MAKDEFSLTSLVVVIVVSGFIIRHFFFRGPSSSSDASSGDASTRQAREQAQAETLNNRYEDAVAQIQQIFPYVDRRDVWWELRRNGLNVSVTTERILSGGLDNPPVTFQPPPPPTAVIAAAAAAAAATATATPIPKQQSLIERYNLQDRLNEPEAPSTPSSSSATGSATPNKTWSSNKEERQAMLKKRRDDMILAARRKMEAKIAAEKAAQK